MKQHTASRPAGTIIVTAPEGHVILEQDTVQCVHCGGHFPIQPGSGKTRGFCHKCMGPICGPKCQECLPEEKWLDLVEKGKVPLIVTTSR